MQNRREFLKTAAFAALGAGWAANQIWAGGVETIPRFHINSRAGVVPRMRLRFFSLRAEVASCVYGGLVFAVDHTGCAGRNRI